MGAIASLSLNLGVELKDWASGLNKASNAVDKFYAGVGAKVAKAAGPFVGVVQAAGQLGASVKQLGASAVAPLAGVTKGISSIGAGALKTLGPVAALAGGIAVGVAGIGLAAGTAAAAMTSAGIDRIDALTDASQRLGVTTDALSELQYAANLTGSSAEDLATALEKMSTNLGDSANKATPTSDALKRLGLDAKALADAGPDKAFKLIVGGFEKIPNASEKASIAMDIFGKGGIKILNTLGAGSGEIERLSVEARKFGVSVSQVDAAKIGVAKDSLDRAGAAVEGIGNTLAIELAPLIEVAANAFTEWFGSTVEEAGGVQGAISTIADAVGWVADAGWTAEKSLQEAFAGIIGGAASVAEALGLSAGKTLRDTADALHQSIARDFDTPPSDKLGKFLDDVKIKAAAVARTTADAVKANLGAGTSMDTLAKSIGDVTAKLKEQADSFGMTAAEADVYKLAQQGATEAQLADAKAQAKRLAGLEAGKKDADELKGFAKQLTEGSLTAAEKLDAELTKIGKARDAGLIDDATAGRAGAKARKDAGGDGMDSTKFAGAAELGSSEAYSSIVSAVSGRGGDSMADVAKASTRTADNTGRLVTSVNNLAKTLGGAPVEMPL